MTVIEFSEERMASLRNRLAFELFDDRGALGVDPDRVGGDDAAATLAAAVRDALEHPADQPTTWKQAP